LGGNVFSRLRAHRKTYGSRLSSFSVLLIEDPKHRREVETALIRAGAATAELNVRKRPASERAGDDRDFDAGTYVFIAQKPRGKRKRTRRRRRAA
jgi:hypothetical protein